MWMLPLGVNPALWGPGRGTRDAAEGPFWPLASSLATPPPQPHLDILIPTAGGGKALARVGLLTPAPLEPGSRLSMHLCLSPWVCASLLCGAPRYLEATVRVSKGCVRVGLRV